jgi:beta-glucanase (GH16 family)
VPAANWKYDTGPGSSFGTGEIETMTNSTSNVYEDGNGHLVLKALHSGSDPRSGWTSGRIETQSSSFGAPPGGVVMMQSSIQQPNLTTANGAGYWPAFWMLGSTLRTGTGWPTSGEVDILEDINSRSSVFGTLHCGVSPGGPCNESTGIGSGERACSGCQTAYHTYAVQIDRSVSPEQIRWYLDGQNYFTVNSTQVDATTWANAVDHPFFIIYDLAMGGGFPDAFGGGPNAATVSGGQMNIDYVAVYNKAPGGGGTSGLLSQGKPATASSTENSGTPASAAVDGNTGTRWSSAFSDPQWLRVDLGATHTISQVKLNWEAAYAKAFQIQTSTDGTNWTTVYSTTTGTGGNQTLNVSGSGRYVRVYGTQRATQYGYSLWEFQVLGT